MQKLSNKAMILHALENLGEDATNDQIRSHVLNNFEVALIQFHGIGDIRREFKTRKALEGANILSPQLAPPPQEYHQTIQETKNPLDLAGEERIVQITPLEVDYSYQRPVKPYHKKIANAWDSQKAGRLILAERPDGKLFILDGQQRREAMILLNIKEWKAIVHKVRDIQHEAEIFSAINGGEKTAKGLTFREVFRARLAANDPTAVSIKFVVEQHGLVIESNKRWPHISCINTLYELCQIKGSEHLSLVLEVLTKAWPENTDALEASFVLGCSKVLSVPQVDPKRLILRLSETSPLVFNQSLKGTGGKSGVGVAGRLYSLMAARYNKGMRNRIPETILTKKESTE